MKFLLLAGYLVTLACIPHLLLLKKRPSASLAWLWAILFIPFLGAGMYVAIGTDRLTRRRLKRRNPFSARTSSTPAPAVTTDAGSARLLKELPRRDQQFFQLLSRINQLPLSSAAELRVLRNSEEFYPALEARISAAQKRLDIEFYIWRPDQTGERFVRRLTEAARRGVKVRLLLDGVGSHGFSQKLLSEYARAGGEFAWFKILDPKRNRYFLNLRNHRKLQIVDGSIAFVGGMNMGREYEGLEPAFGRWRDVQVEVTGSIAAELQEVFVDDWHFATGQNISEPPAPDAEPAPARYPVHIVLGGPDRRNEPISKSIVSLLNEATDRVWIATGYFVPVDMLMAALELAASRGVDVRLLISEKNAHPWLLRAGRSYYGQLLSAGVRIFEYSAGINHAKIAVADDHWGMVGSANLDYRSMRLNFELNLLFHSPERTSDLAAILKRDFELSQEIDPAVFGRRPFRQRFVEAALRPLSPLL
ncbi:MAG TPA: cardiolipin synthase [Opitutaceae bacterium]|jgi:cardiolipin synthase|nr:cardiolipin synthase [Opitutaceae bacterium]